MGQKRCHMERSASGGIEIQSATMKINRCLESFLVSKSIRPLLDGLNLGVQSFTHGIGDRMCDVRQNIVQMALDQMSGVFHGFKTTPNCPPEPAPPEGSGLLQRGRMPQGTEFLFHRPRPSHFQIHGPEGLKTLSLGFGHIVFRIQPQVFGSFQFGNASIPNFLLSDGIDRLSHMSHDVKTVKGDLFGGLGEMRERGLKERLPHVHRHGPDPSFAPGRAWRRTSSASRFSGLPPHIQSFLPSSHRPASYTGVPLQWPSHQPQSPPGAFPTSELIPAPRPASWILQASSQLIRRRRPHSTHHRPSTHQWPTVQTSW